MTFWIPITNIDDIFKRYFYKIKDLLELVDHDSILVVDIAAMIHVVIDFAIYSMNGDRHHAFDCLWKSYLDTSPDLKKDIKNSKRLFDERSDFYSEIVRSGPRVNICMPKYLPEGEAENATVGCAIAFVNCICTPGYIENYGAAPIFVRGFHEMLFISKRILFPLIENLCSLFEEIWKSQPQNCPQPQTTVRRTTLRNEPKKSSLEQQYEAMLSSSDTLNAPQWRNDHSSSKGNFWGHFRLGCYITGAIFIVWIIIELLVG